MDSSACSPPVHGPWPSWPARAFAFACAAVLLSAFGHSLTTGMAPSAGTLAAAAAAASLFFAPLARRRLPVPVSAGTLSVLQIGLHVFFSGVGAPGSMPHAMSGDAHMEMAASPSWDAFVPTIPMACGHVVASAAIAWVLHGGDAAAGRVLELTRLRAARTMSIVLHALGILLRAGQRSLPDATKTLRCAPCRREPAAVGSMPLLAHEVARRGPPQGMAVFV